MFMNSKKAKKLLLQFVPMFTTFWLKCPGLYGLDSFTAKNVELLGLYPIRNGLGIWHGLPDIRPIKVKYGRPSTIQVGQISLTPEGTSTPPKGWVCAMWNKSTWVSDIYFRNGTEPIYIVGALKSIYEMKCALLDKIVNFGTQIVEIFLYRNFDGSKLVRPVFGRHLSFQNGRHMGPIFSNISKRKTLEELITSWFFHERTLEVSRLT